MKTASCMPLSESIESTCFYKRQKRINVICYPSKRDNGERHTTSSNNNNKIVHCKWCAFDDKNAIESYSMKQQSKVHERASQKLTLCTNGTTSRTAEKKNGNTHNKLIQRREKMDEREESPNNPNTPTAKQCVMCMKRIIYQTSILLLLLCFLLRTFYFISICLLFAMFCFAVHCRFYSTVARFIATYRDDGKESENAKAKQRYSETKIERVKAWKKTTYAKCFSLSRSQACVCEMHVLCKNAFWCIEVRVHQCHTKNVSYNTAIASHSAID